MPTAKPKPSTYELKITLLEIDPPIWRRIQVPSTMRLSCLHDAIQAVFGWTDTHIHQFEKDGKHWGDPANREFEDDTEIIDEGKVSVGKVLLAEGDSMCTILATTGGMKLSWRKSSPPLPARRSRLASLVNVDAHRRTLEDRSAMRNSWRSSSSLDMRSSPIFVVGQAGGFMQKSLT